MLWILACNAGPGPAHGAHGDEPPGGEPLFPAADPSPWSQGTGSPPEEEPAPGDFLFAEGSVHAFDLSLSSGARSALQSDPATDVQATLTYDGQSWQVGVHLKGSFSYRPLSMKAAFKVDFGQFVPGQRFFGLRRLTFNNMVQDGSMIREHVAYHAYSLLGVPAPRHGYAELTVDGEPYGVYGILETPDGTFAEREWPGDDDGPIYEGGYGIDVESGDAYQFQLQREGDAEPYVDLAALIDALADVPDDGWLDAMNTHFDATAVFRMWAMDLVSGHRDGYVKRKNNFLIYHGLASDRWWMIPWGQDQALRDNMDVHGGYSGALVKRCSRTVACQSRLDAALGYVADTWEAWDLRGYAEAAGALIEDACERDPRHELPCGYDKVVDMIAERPAEVRAELAGQE